MTIIVFDPTCNIIPRDISNLNTYLFSLLHGKCFCTSGRKVEQKSMLLVFQGGSQLHLVDDEDEVTTYELCAQSKYGHW